MDNTHLRSFFSFFSHFHFCNRVSITKKLSKNKKGTKTKTTKKGIPSKRKSSSLSPNNVELNKETKKGKRKIRSNIDSVSFFYSLSFFSFLLFLLSRHNFLSVPFLSFKSYHFLFFKLIFSY